MLNGAAPALNRRRIKDDGTPEEYQAIHENVMKTSPDYFNISQPVRLDAKLEIA